jgi:putative DNA primase/helicase
LDAAVPDTLRAHKRLFCTTCNDQSIPDPYHPGLLAAVTAPDGRMVSVHRTFLTKPGGKAHGGKSKRLMPAIAPGSTKGAAIRLYPHGEQLGICEGIETAMACHLLFGLPTWAAVSSGGLACVEIPPEVELVGIFADADAAGEQAALALGRRLMLSGRRFKIWPPPNRGWDWADMLSERGNAGRYTTSLETHGVV